MNRIPEINDIYAGTEYNNRFIIRSINTRMCDDKIKSYNINWSYYDSQEILRNWLISADEFHHRFRYVKNHTIYDELAEAFEGE